MRVFLYLLDTLADWEIAYITAELHSRRFFSDASVDFTFIKVAQTYQPVKTMGGVLLTPDLILEEVIFEKGDLLILPGADHWLEDAHKKIIELVAGLLDRHITVAAICGATLALAKQGILNTRKHTSNDPGFLNMMVPEYSGQEMYIDEPVVTEGFLMTASGVMPLEFSYEVLKKTKAFKCETLEAWYQLYKTGDAQYFHAILDSLQ